MMVISTLRKDVRVKIFSEKKSVGGLYFVLHLSSEKDEEGTCGTDEREYPEGAFLHRGVPSP